MQKKDFIMPLYGLVPFTWHGWFLCLLKNDDRNRVDIAIPGHYEESYLYNVTQW